MIPRRDELTICFAHPVYDLQTCFEKRDTGIRSFQVWDGEELGRRAAEADILVISGLWRDDLLDQAPKLRFVQSISAGVDQYPKDLLAARGIPLASARGVNARAVSDHAFGLILTLTRRLAEAHDEQARHVWRGMGADPSKREDELGDKTLLVVGLGAIGDRIAKLGRAFDMRVLGIRRDPSAGAGQADAVYGMDAFESLLPETDIVVLACPLTKETANLVNARTLGLMKDTAYLVNVARGGCVDEDALSDALTTGQIAGAAIDVAVEEPLPASSKLWDLPNLFITSHTGGETRRYEDNVVDTLMDNLDRLWRGEASLRNQVV